MKICSIAYKPQWSTYILCHKLYSSYDKCVFATNIFYLLSGALQALRNSPFGNGGKPLLVGSIYCAGYEPQLANCSGFRSGRPPQPYSYCQNVAGIRCLSE